MDQQKIQFLSKLMKLASTTNNFLNTEKLKKQLNVYSHNTVKFFENLNSILKPINKIKKKDKINDIILNNKAIIFINDLRPIFTVVTSQLVSLYDLKIQKDNGLIDLNQYKNYYKLIKLLISILNKLGCTFSFEYIKNDEEKNYNKRGITWKNIIRQCIQRAISQYN